MDLYEILKAAKIGSGAATDYYTALLAKSMPFANVDMNDYAAIAKIVRSGKASQHFSIGQLIPMKYTATNGVKYDMPFVIVDFRDVTLRDGSSVPGMIIQSLYATLEAIQFDAAEPDRPASEDYQGQIAANGWNRYSHSAQRQWLNSSAQKGEWWTPQNDYDVAPSQHNTYNGFMHGIPQKFLDMLKPVKVETCRNYRDPDSAQSSSVYEYDETYDVFWLPSREEEYITVNEPNHREGRVWQYWIDKLTPEAIEKGEPLPQVPYASEEVQHILSSHRHFALENHSSAVVVRLRSAYRSSSRITWSVGAAGYVTGSYAYGSYRCAPACAIC